jgi:conserved hypothetical ATP-binding protein
MKVRKYRVGEELFGKVINIYQGNLIVELEPGVIGRVLGGAEQVNPNNGEVVNVKVKSDDDESILLELIIEPGLQEFNYSGEMSGWSGWKSMPIGHEKAMTMLVELCKHTDAFRQELTKAREKCEEEKAASRQVYDSHVQRISKEFEEEKEAITSECNTKVELTVEREKAARSVCDACAKLLKDMLDEMKEDKKNERDLESVKNKFGVVEKRQQELTEVINSKIQAYKELQNCQIAEAERDRNEKIDKVRSQQLERDTQAELRQEAELSRISKLYGNDIRFNFNRDLIHAYQREVNSSRFNANNYSCQTEILDYIMLGSVCLPISNVSREDYTVVQAVEAQVCEMGEKNLKSHQYIVKIPYAQRLEDGISLLIRYAPSCREMAQKLIQPLLFKLFMSFPAGKLEATMIDPLELGANFADIPKLAEGPNSARIIDTKIWSKEKDIENSIATLRQRLENMTQAYGGDQKSRLNKEVIRALAITDFPVGFSDAALKDLHAIVRNSASLGVCVYICANNEELERLKQRNATLVNEITQCLIETEVMDNQLVFVGYEKMKLSLELDEMQDVEEHKDRIITLISDAVEHTQLRVERFESMFQEDIYDSNNWFTGNQDEIAIPLGIKGANTVVKMILGRGLGSTEHHALIAGQTGAGKSTLLHTLIMSTLISYSPDEVQMYLLDFKEGVEFSGYARYRLPSLRVVAINSEREFGLSVLKELCKELEIRAEHFKRYGVSDINGYTNLTDVPSVPKLLLIFDEVQELFRSTGERDYISRDCLSYLNRLVMQGRAAGIHIILACQDFHNCAGLEAYFSQMAIRIAVRGSVEGAASILASDNAGIHTLQNQPAGAAIYNGSAGVESANNFFQVSYIDEKSRLQLLACLEAYFTDSEVAPLYEELQTRVLLSNAEDNIHNYFNKLILRGKDYIERIAKSKDGYGLFLGQGFGRDCSFVSELRQKKGDNLLIVGRNEKMALSLMELSTMSVLHEGLCADTIKSRAMVYILDMFSEDLADGECDFDFLEGCFPQQIRLAKMQDIEDLIKSVYEVVMGRIDGTHTSEDRVFLMLFGINRARKLQYSRMYENESEGELNLSEMLREIVRLGPQCGVNTIVWGESIRGVEMTFGEKYDALFDKRIAYGLDKESMEILVAENDSESISGKTAIYMDFAKDVKNSRFRPYDIPAKIWVERYSEVYREIINEESD